MKLKFLLIALAALFTVTSPAPLAAAQKSIGAVLSSDLPRYREAYRSFVKSLTARGYGSGKVELSLQTPNPDQLSWSNAVRKLNAYRPDMIVAFGSGAASTANREAESIPVINVDVYSVDGGTKGVCGVSSRVPLQTLIKTALEVRKFKTLGIIKTSKEPGSNQQSEDIKKIAHQFGISTVEANISSPASLENALNSLLAKADFIMVTESSAASRVFDKIVSRCMAKSVPVISAIPDSGEKGALISLEINSQEQGHLAADVAVRLLEGANAANLPLLTPRRIDLVVNMRTAKNLDMNLPFSLLGSATRIIK